MSFLSGAGYPLAASPFDTLNVMLVAVTIGPWLVHLYTASGAVAAFLALRAIVIADDYRSAFTWLYAATIIDTSDGWLARSARVKERLPNFDGARLDDLVDYLTFVFVPAFLLYHAGRFPSRWAAPVACVMLLASAYGFAQKDAKTADHFFTGFPSYWNIVALYLYAAAMPPGANAAVVVALAALVFVPIGYVYPSRTPTLRGLTVGLCILWGALLLVLIRQLPTPSPLLLWGSLLFPAYYAIVSVVLHSRRAVARENARTLH